MPRKPCIVKHGIRKISKKTVILLILLAVFAALRLTGAELTLLAYSDSHGSLGGLNRLRILIEAERRTAPDLLLIDAGDTLQGSFEGAWRNGAATLAMMNAMGVDFWVPGNHDFEYGMPSPGDFSGTILGADWCHRQPGTAAWKLTVWRGLRIAFIGIGENRMQFRMLQWPGDPEETSLDRIMPAIRRARPHAVILIRHGGLYWRGGTLHKLLRRYPEIDLVIGAHTHQADPGTRVGTAWYVQSSSHARSLVRMRLDFDEDRGKLRQITSELLTTENIDWEPWPETVRPLYFQARRAGDAPVAIMEPSPAEAMRRAAKADAALYIGAARLDPLPATAAELYRQLPYRDRIVTVEITPAMLTELLDEEKNLQERYPDRQCQIAIEPGWRRREKITLAITDYYLAGSGGLTTQLRPLVIRGAYRETGIDLRDAVQLPTAP